MLKISLLGLGLFIGSLFAQDNYNVISNSVTTNYQVSISSKDNLVVGKNQLKITVAKKGKRLSGMDVNLTLYTPDNKTLEFNHLTNDNNSYIVDTALTKKGDYTYVLKYSSQAGAVSHFSRGSFKI